MRFTCFLLLLGIAGFSSCTYDNAEELMANKSVPSCADSTVTYRATIYPILQNNCRSCHNTRFPLGNVNLDTYEQTKPYVDNGLLVGVTTQAPGFDAMPQGAPKLSDCDLALIKKWVADGAPNN